MGNYNLKSKYLLKIHLQCKRDNKKEKSCVKTGRRGPVADGTVPVVHSLYIQAINADLYPFSWEADNLLPLFLSD